MRTADSSLAMALCVIPLYSHCADILFSVLPRRRHPFGVRTSIFEGAHKMDGDSSPRKSTDYLIEDEESRPATLSQYNPEPRDKRGRKSVYTLLLHGVAWALALSVIVYQQYTISVRGSVDEPTLEPRPCELSTWFCQILMLMLCASGPENRAASSATLSDRSRVNIHCKGCSRYGGSRCQLAGSSIQSWSGCYDRRRSRAIWCGHITRKVDFRPGERCLYYGVLSLDALSGKITPILVACLRNAVC